MSNRKGRKRYNGQAHLAPYDGEDLASDYTDRDYDPREDLDAVVFEHRRDLLDRDREPLNQFTSSETVEAVSMGPAASATYHGGDTEDRERQTRKRPGIQPTRQLVQDAGGYATQVDPASNYAERYYGYCLNCGEPINHAGVRVCEVELAGGDRCVLEAPKGYLITGCQSCREWWDYDRGYHRSGKGRQAKTCKPTAEERAAWARKGTVKSRCAREWAAKLKQAARKGVDRYTAERTLAAMPKLRHHDRIRLELDRLDAVVRADRQRKRQAEADQSDWDEYDIVLKLLPEDAPSAPAQSKPAGVNGTGFRSVPGEQMDWSQAEEVVRLPLMGEGTFDHLDQVIQALRDSGRL